MTLKDTIKNQINQVLKKEYQLADVQFQVDYPPQSEMGDYSSNVALLLAQQLKKNPMEIGQEIIDQLKEQKEFVKVEVIKPGFINFHLNSA